MTVYDYDLVILGGGAAGIVSGVMAGGLKLHTLLIENNKLGGECSHTGCVPSKALLHAAKIAKQLRTASAIGLKDTSLTCNDASGVLRWVRETVKNVAVADDSESLLKKQGTEIRIGNAHFIDPHTIDLDGQTITASNFILATGSHPLIPDIPGLDEVRFHTNQTIFNLNAIPDHLLVVGGGPVGVEMAQAFQLLGSNVTLVQRNSRILLDDDVELTCSLEKCLREDGIDLRLDTTVTEVKMVDNKKVAILSDKDIQSELNFDEILMAAGRGPNVEGLNLQAAGVDVATHSIPTDDALRTSASHIYACGDLLGKFQYSHMAEYEAKIVVRNIAFPGTQKASFELTPWTTFTEPELAHIGLTEEQARDKVKDIDVLRQPFSQDDRALVDSEARGMVKVITHGLSGKILGVHILGPRAGEILQEWVLAMQKGLGIRSIADGIHVYPTLTMANQHTAQRWYELKADKPVVQQALKCYAKNIRPLMKKKVITAIATGAICALLLGKVWNSKHKNKVA